ncbi:MAG: hypothetical protein ACRCTZ_13680 [Sarcina sp.]
MVNKIGRHNKEWKTGEIRKLHEMDGEPPEKVARILGKTVGSVNQERFRRGLTKYSPRLTDEEKRDILFLRWVGLSFTDIALVVKRSYYTVYKICNYGGDEFADKCSKTS